MFNLGHPVTFDFTLPRVSLADKPERRTGTGVIHAYNEWVGNSPAYAVRVTKSADYPAGTIITVRTINVKGVQYDKTIHGYNPTAARKAVR